MAPPRFGGLGGGRAHLPPPEKILGGGEPTPPKGRCFDFLRGAKQFLPQNQGKNGQIFPLAPKALAEFLKEPTIVFKLAQICVKTAQKRKIASEVSMVAQKCPYRLKNAKNDPKVR